MPELMARQRTAARVNPGKDVKHHWLWSTTANEMEHQLGLHEPRLQSAGKFAEALPFVLPQILQLPQDQRAGANAFGINEARYSGEPLYSVYDDPLVVVGLGSVEGGQWD